MSDKYMQALEEKGVDLKAVLDRFMGNEELYKKFLGKFLNDQNYTNLMTNLEQKNYAEAFKCAHTLKGVSANLGLNPLFNAVSELTELLRGKSDDEVDVDAVEKWRGNTEKEYKIFSDIINANQ